MAQNKVKETRERFDVTQKQLGELSGVPYHTLTKIEQGQVMPKVDTALSIASALNVTVEDLFEARPIPHKPHTEKLQNQSQL